MTLERLNEFVIKANESNSQLQKKLVIQQFKDVTPYWLMTYDTINYQYHIKSANLKKNSHLVAERCPYPDLLSLLHGLHKREHTGHDAISIINKFVSDRLEYENLIHCVIDRNLKTRTDAKLINAVYPGTIPEFEVALAKDYDEKTAKYFTCDGTWVCSRKLDGCRCLAVIDGDGDVKIYSRSGKQFLVLSKVIDAIKELGLTNFVFDGEICIVDDNGDEDFTGIMKEIRKKDHTIQNPKFKIFDGLPKEAFEAKYYEKPLIQRLVHLLEIVPKDHAVLSLLKQVRVNNEDKFNELIEQSREGHWEGLILRKNVAYEGKRSKDMLKFKDFHEEEYTVIGVTNGPFRHIDKITGLEVETEMMTSISIKHKGHEVGVGSGFKLNERMYYHENPNEIIGKVITVKYFEESQDENGIPSLRFPTFKVLHGTERNT